jgi:hypothetical protein
MLPRRHIQLAYYNWNKEESGFVALVSASDPVVDSIVVVSHWQVQR